MATADEVIAVARGLGRKKKLSDEQLATLVSGAWYLWQQANNPTLSASCFALMSLRHLWARRDLPGCGVSRRDISMRLRMCQGAGMVMVTDTAPGPDRQVEEEEWFKLFVAGLTEGQRRLVELHRAGVERTEDLAREMGLSSGRVSQMRREVLAKAKAAR